MHVSQPDGERAAPRFRLLVVEQLEDGTLLFISLANNELSLGIEEERVEPPFDWPRGAQPAGRIRFNLEVAVPKGAFIEFLFKDRRW